MHNTLKHFIFPFLFCGISLYGQKMIDIDLSKAKDAQSITVNINEKDLGDLKLVLNGVTAGDENNYKFSGANFDDKGLIDLTKVYDGTKHSITYTLAGLENIKVPDEGFYKYKIIHTPGVATPVLFTANEFAGGITIVKEKIVEDRKKFTELDVQEAAIQYVKSTHDPDKYYSEKMGIYLEKNTVHIFIDENGNQILTGVPTTAKESYLYQVHLLVAKESTDNAKFKFSYEGKYTPKFNIEKTSEGITSLNADVGDKTKPTIVEIEFAKIGPFTDNFTIKLEKIITDASKKVSSEMLLNNRIDVAKLYHVSISTGLVVSTLRNPQNIEKMPLPNGIDTTLIADDPNVRGIITVMATYYPRGRSFLFPPSGGPFDPSRIGIQVGAQLNAKVSENFFLGLSHDFARGGTISYGAHFGRRNYVAGLSQNFKYGKDKFNLPELHVKQEWQVGFYFGVVIDTRVAIELIKSLATPGK